MKKKEKEIFLSDIPIMESDARAIILLHKPFAVDHKKGMIWPIVHTYPFSRPTTLTDLTDTHSFGMRKEKRTNRFEMIVRCIAYR